MGEEVVKLLSSNGVMVVAQERLEQIEKHGYTIQEDVSNNYDAQLRIAAVRMIRENIVASGQPKVPSPILILMLE